MVGGLGHHPLIVIAVTVVAAVEVCQGTLTIEVDIVIYAMPWLYFGRSNQCLPKYE